MSEFDLIALGDIADIRMGQSPDSSSYTDDDRFMPFLQGCGDFSEEFPETHVFCANPGKVAPEGSVLVSVRAPVGTTNIADQEYCIGRGLASVKSSVLPAVYLREIFNLSASFLYRRAQGSTFDAISSQDLRAFPIPVPKKKEQLEQLVDIFQSVNLEIRTTQALIDKYGVIKQGMMADLFSRGIDPATAQLRPSVQDAPELYVDSILGPIPCGWNVNRFDLIAEVIDPNPSHRYPESVKFGGVPIASTENFDGDDEFDLSKCKNISEAEFNKQLERCNYRCDDVIFARKGRIGFARKYGMAKKAFSHTLVVMKAKTGIDPSYLLWLVRSEQFLSCIDFEMNSNSGVPTLGIDVIKRIPSLMPSEAEQGLIARVLDQLNEVLSKEKKKLRQLHLKKAGLMRDLLTGKVPVIA